ncbi:MAG TPA: phosphopyruvate hydratase [Candidatus Acidoferrales bacterium]|nr:phosphopyruvate hydratase [Candidatus Acidoferrales bacterium]
MKTLAITAVQAFEILDSRGHPTIQVEVTLAGGACGAAAVPSGASTGQREAVELRDGDSHRFRGKGVQQAVRNVVEAIGPAIRGRDAGQQAEIDHYLCELDGTPNKARLGANAILGVSMAVARAAAAAMGQPLYRYLGGADATLLPVPMLNVINGGRHALNHLDFQEFMIVPHGAPTFAEAMRWASETYHTLRDVLVKRGLATGVGDEGGFAPDVHGHEDALALLVEAIERAGYRPGEQIAIALDPAASEFSEAGCYTLERSARGTLGAAEMVELYRDAVQRFPIILIEDGLSEDDWDGWRLLTRELGSRIQLIGDDIFVTNPDIIRKGIAAGVANGVLIKLNQIGTVTETIEAITLARTAGYHILASHRSGETEDTFLADFTVATFAGQLKTGAPCRGERTAKYNRLMRIEAALVERAQFAGRRSGGG